MLGREVTPHGDQWLWLVLACRTLGGPVGMGCGYSVGHVWKAGWLAAGRKHSLFLLTAHSLFLLIIPGHRNVVFY